MAATTLAPTALEDGGSTRRRGLEPRRATEEAARHPLCGPGTSARNKPLLRRVAAVLRLESLTLYTELRTLQTVSY